MLPLKGSKAIDAGDPAYNTATSPATDQRRLPRVADGNADGIARIDIGAVEVTANQLVNGDFDGGRTGFATQYASSHGNGGMFVVANPTAFNPLFSSFGDHTTGKGLMLVADGATTANKYVWQETVNVAKGKVYLFSDWAASASGINGNHTDPSPAKLAVYVNGVQVGTTFTVAAKNGVWGQFSAVWNSNLSTTATIKIVDLNTTSTGNDFALDDMSFVVAPNLLVNGDFSAGYTGFYSQYHNEGNPGTSQVGHNPNTDFGSVFASFGDHTTGTGLMLMADGATTPNTYIWQETVSVQKASVYDFSGFAASMDKGTDVSPARLAFYVNGVQIGNTFTVTATGGHWGQFLAQWNSGTSTTATVKIVDLNTQFTGNDFVLDDLVFNRSSSHAIEGPAYRLV